MKKGAFFILFLMPVVLWAKPLPNFLQGQLKPQLPIKQSALKSGDQKLYKLDSVSTYYIDGADLVYAGNMVFSYNGAGKIASQTDSYWDEEEQILVPSGKYTYSYNAFGFLETSKSLYDWNNTTKSWSDSVVENFYYNTRGNIYEYTLINSFGYDFYNDVKETFEFDALGNEIENVSYYKRSGDWVKSSVYKYEYDSQRNRIKGEHYIADEGTEDLILVEVQLYEGGAGNCQMQKDFGWENHGPGVDSSRFELTVQGNDTIVRCYQTAGEGEWFLESVATYSYTDNGIFDKREIVNYDSYMGEIYESISIEDQELDENDNPLRYSYYELQDGEIIYLDAIREMSYNTDIKMSEVNMGFTEDYFQNFSVNAVSESIEYANEDYSTNPDDWQPEMKYFYHYSPMVYSGVDKAVTAVSVYPNPASGSISVSNIENGLLQIFTPTGELVMVADIADGQSISVEHLAKGFYLYTVTTSNTNQSGTFIKE